MNDLVIRGRTRLMGIIGDPIVQAKTPAAINRIFAARGANIVCIPLHVPAVCLAEVWRGLKGMLNLVGFGVTLPHKQSAVQLCDSLDPVAERVGAVNVVRRERDGSFRGSQFEGRGFVRGLQACGVTIVDRKVLMIGAGGAAVAIAFALIEVGAASITVANRSPDKAEALTDTVNSDFGRRVARVGQPQPGLGQLVVNATSLGLRAADPLPLDPEALRAGMTLAEVIAEPEMTPLLAQAQARGLEAISGIHMIKGQIGLIADHLCEV